MRVLTSTLRRSVSDQRSATQPVAPVLWPRWMNGRVQMVRIPAWRIPPGWQNVRVRVEQRTATCAEVKCPMWANGWTEVDVAGRSVEREGKLSAAEAVELYGTVGPKGVAPKRRYHRPGKPCPRLHKTAKGTPPVYLVDGRVVLWNEFEDSLLGGWQRASSMPRSL